VFIFEIDDAMVDGEIVIHAGILAAKYVSTFTVPIPNARQLESERLD
jgi:hypothetical protein